MIKEELRKHIATVSYDIIDNFIAPACDIQEVFADTYLANITTYESDEVKAEELAVKILQHYKLDSSDASYFVDMPIAAFSLFILENSDYLENNKDEA